MLGVEWSNLSLAGAFVFGLAAGVVLTLRLAAVLVKFLGELERKRNGKSNGKPSDGP